MCRLRKQEFKLSWTIHWSKLPFLTLVRFESNKMKYNIKWSDSDNHSSDRNLLKHLLSPTTETTIGTTPIHVNHPLEDPWQFQQPSLQACVALLSCESTRYLSSHWSYLDRDTRFRWSFLVSLAFSGVSCISCIVYFLRRLHRFSSQTLLFQSNRHTSSLKV